MVFVFTAVNFATALSMVVSGTFELCTETHGQLFFRSQSKQEHERINKYAF